MNPNTKEKLEQLLWADKIRKALFTGLALLLAFLLVSYLAPQEIKNYKGHITSEPIPSNFSIFAEFIRLLPSRNNIEHRSFLPSRLRYYCNAKTVSGTTITGRCLEKAKPSKSNLVNIQEQIKLFGLITEYYIYPNKAINADPKPHA